MGSHRLPGDPSRASALLSDPGRIGRPGHRGLPDTAPAFGKTKASATTAYRGSITRLQHTLSTLHDRRRRRPCKTRFRLAGSASTGGDSNPLGHTERFQIISFSFPGLRLSLAMGCQVAIAQKIIDHGADYVLGLKGNQPTLEADAIDYFRTAPANEIVSTTTLEKGHGRIETRQYKASANVSWIASDRRYPGEPRFPGIKTLVQVHRTTEQAGQIRCETSIYIASMPLDIERLAAAIRGHWGVEAMHWMLDVLFKDDLSRYRQGHGAKNMAVVRRFALDLVRAAKIMGSVKNRRLVALLDPKALLQILNI